ncbi:MAG: hypothetical protein OHK0046_34980 [Anaerolineae bacterium]
MKRVFISYAQQDSEVALYLTTQLRGRGVNVFFDYERMMNSERFTRRMANEIKARDFFILIQSPDSLASPLVQEEIRCAQQNNIDIIPIAVRPIKLRDTSEFAYLLHTRPLDFTNWKNKQQAADVLDVLEKRFATPPREDLITVESVAVLAEFSTLRAHSSWVRAIAFSPDGMFMASCANDNTAVLWDTRPRDFLTNPPQPLNTIQAHDASVWGVAFSHNIQLLATCSNDNLVRIWSLQDLPDLYELTQFADHHDPVYALAFSPDGRLLGSASHDKTVHLRDISRIGLTGRAEAIVPLLHASQVYSLAFSPQSDILATASRDSTIRFWYLDPAKSLQELRLGKPEFLIGHSSWVNHVAFSPIGVVLASASHDTTIRLWDPFQFETIAILKGHTDSVNSIAFSPDGRLLVSTSKDNTVKIWDIATQRDIATIRGHSKWVNSASFSPDGSLLVTASADHTIKFWGVGQQVSSR